MNVTPLVAALVEADAATLGELNTIYSYRDALDLLELKAVKVFNEKAAYEKARSERRG